MLIALVGAVVFVIVSGVAQAATFTFSFTPEGLVSGTGQLTTSDPTSPFLITDATGTITIHPGNPALPPGTFTIDGVSSFEGANNLLYFPPPPQIAGDPQGFVDGFGIALSTTAGIDFRLFDINAAFPGLAFIGR